MKSAFKLIIGFLLLTFPLMAQLSGLDDGRTPKQRFTQGLMEGFAHSYLDEQKCSQRAFNSIFDVKKKIYPFSILGDFSQQQPILAKGFISTLLDTLNKALSVLYRNGDQDILNHRICTGLYNYGEVNARSYEEGYILVDPKVIKMMWDLPNRSSFSDSQVYLHELAHQFQYWHGNQFQDDKTSRRTELAADCVGSALLWLSWQGLSQDILSMESLGVIAASESVGDFDMTNPDHHGTPIERMKASLKGQEISKTLFLTSKKLLRLCESAISREN